MGNGCLLIKHFACACSYFIKSHADTWTIAIATFFRGLPEARTRIECLRANLSGSCFLKPLTVLRFCFPVQLGVVETPPYDNNVDVITEKKCLAQLNGSVVDRERVPQWQQSPKNNAGSDLERVSLCWDPRPDTFWAAFNPTGMYIQPLHSGKHLAAYGLFTQTVIFSVGCGC
jgi:hypothetical protein